MKKSRLGSDPLDWIGKKEGKTKKSKQDKQSKHSKQNKNSLLKGGVECLQQANLRQ